MPGSTTQDDHAASVRERLGLLKIRSSRYGVGIPRSKPAWNDLSRFIASVGAIPRNVCNAQSKLPKQDITHIGVGHRHRPSRLKNVKIVDPSLSCEDLHEEKIFVN